MGLLDTEAMAEALRNWAPNGLLAKVYSSGDSAKRYVKGLLSDPSGTVQQWMDQGLPTQYEAQQAMNKAKGNQYNPDAVSAYDQKHQSLAQDSGLAGLTVWHGSPHKFDKFDMSKIGTGEGAQAYGHGLYMAESPQVAKQYQAQVSADGFLVGDKVFDPSTLKHLNVKTMVARGDLDGAIAKASQIAKSDSPVASMAASDLEILNNIKAAGGLQKNPGAMYKVDIPDEAVARMLDWDKPFAKQSPEVKKILKDSGLVKQYKQNLVDYSTPQATRGREQRGQNYLALLEHQLGGEVAASAKLKELGIPGIRYLDGGSRGTGNGTSNYVLFSDQLPRILETNGVPTGQAPWAPGEWQGLLQSQPR